MRHWKHRRNERLGVVLTFFINSRQLGTFLFKHPAIHSFIHSSIRPSTCSSKTLCVYPCIHSFSTKFSLGRTEKNWLEGWWFYLSSVKIRTTFFVQVVLAQQMLHSWRRCGLILHLLSPPYATNSQKSLAEAKSLQRKNLIPFEVRHATSGRSRRHDVCCATIYRKMFNVILGQEIMLNQ